MQRKTNSLLKALRKGDKLTAAEIAHRFRIANPSATISNLRNRYGYWIRSIPTAYRRNGKNIRKYVM